MGLCVLKAWQCRFEGPNCNVDINECVRGTSNCGTNSSCSNTVGGFTCTCWHGFTGSETSPPRLELYLIYPFIEAECISKHSMPGLLTAC